MRGRSVRTKLIRGLLSYNMARDKNSFSSVILTRIPLRLLYEIERPAGLSLGFVATN